MTSQLIEPPGGSATCSTSPAHPALRLPRAAALTDAITEPPRGGVSDTELEEIRAKLVAELREVTRELDGGERLQMSVFDLTRALEHPDRCAESRSGFEPSPLSCRRAIGVAAVRRCANGRAPTPHSAVAQVLDSALEDHHVATTLANAPRPPWWAEWLAGLSAAGQAVVEAEAVTWATQLWTSFEWDRLVRPVVGDRDYYWDCTGGVPVTLKARADVRVQTGSRQSLVVVGSGYPRGSWRTALGFPALVATLLRGERAAPARVVGIWPASGAARVCEVDAGLLRVAASGTVAAVAVHVEAGVSLSKTIARRGHSLAARSASATSSSGNGSPSTTG